MKLLNALYGILKAVLLFYKKLIKELRHTSGTSMPLHVDRFETIIGHMPGCGYIPTATERVDWFLPSVGEATYAAAKAHCHAKKLTGGLDYSDMIKLYNHTCFEKYPHFQLAELQTSNLSQNSNRIGGKSSCVYHPNSNHTTSECEKLKSMNNTGQRCKGKGKGKHNEQRYGNRSYSKPKGNGKGGRGKGGKGKGNGRGRGAGKPFDGECRTCGKTGHMARDCYSRKDTTNTFQQNQQTAKTADEATLKFSQFAVHATTGTPPKDQTFYKPSGEDTEGSDDSGDQSDEIVDMNFETTSSEGKVNESSDVNNDSKERLRLFHTWGEKPTMDTDPKGPDTSEWKDTPKSPPKPMLWGDTPSSPITWGNNQRPLPVTSTWGDSETTKNKERYSPSHHPYRFGTCQYCDEEMCTKTALHGPLTCYYCKKWMKDNEDEGFYENDTEVEEGTTVDDTMETQNSEEDDIDETQATYAPQTPPRRLRQAATHILSLLQWRKATDGTVSYTASGPVTLHYNYYTLLQSETVENEVIMTRRTTVRPELLHYGKAHLKTRNKGLQLSQNVVTLQEKEATMRIKTKSTQTPDTLDVKGILDSTTEERISFVSSSDRGLSAPTLLTTDNDSDSSIKISQRCFQPGEPCESNAESAERHREIARNILRKKKRRDKRRRKLSRQLKAITDKQLTVESDEEAAKKIRGNSSNKAGLTESPFVVEFEYGANNQGYWDYDHMIVQFEDCIDVVQTLHPEFEFIFLFDHSCGHDWQRPDGLSVPKVNKSFGGAQPKMRKSKMETEEFLGPFPTILEVGGYQHMVFQDSDSGPWYKSEAEWLASKFDRQTGDSRTKIRKKEAMEIDLRAKGVRAKGNKVAIIELCKQ